MLNIHVDVSEIFQKGEHLCNLLVGQLLAARRDVDVPEAASTFLPLNFPGMEHAHVVELEAHLNNQNRVRVIRVKIIS